MRNRASQLLFAAIMIPMSASEWKILEYGKIPPNKVVFADGKMLVSVNKSNNPIVYPLKEITEITGFEVDLKITGSTPLPMADGEKWDDDAIFRIGVVAEGERTMGRVAAFFSPNWVKELFKMAPKESGIDKIYFYNVGRPPQTVGQTRIFPGSRNLVAEEIIAIAQEGKADYKLKHKLKKPLRVAGLWLSMDGDSTKTKFQVDVSRISLITKESEEPPQKESLKK